MEIKKIEASEIEGLKIASLPTRPTASSAFGGKGYSAKEMKEAFDKLPLFIIERLNALIEYLTRDDEESYLSSFKTGVNENHSLRELISDVTSGELSFYLMVDGKALSERIAIIESDIRDIFTRVEALNERN